MCGILGGTDPDWPYERAIESLRHRGPDDEGLASTRELVLGFRRLAVIDPRQTANQPMASEDAAVCLVFNGEIYGYRDLRRELERQGRSFRTESDTEVLLNAYLEWGDAFVDRLDGMFALGIHDRRQGKLKLLRDRPGIKPLYYFWDGRHFAFASELKAIEILCSGAGLEVDATALYDFLTYRYVPTPKTLYRNVFKLPPAHRLVVDLRRGQVEPPVRYWELPVAIDGDEQVAIEDAGERLRRCVARSVEEQLVADVPVGFFLSGGMDSSAVVAEAAAHHGDLKTFSIGFEVAEHTETRFATVVADLFATHHRVETFSESSMDRFFSELKTWYDEPFCDSSAFPTYFVSKCARESVTVALSGDGGDELFGGYNWYSRFRRYRSFPRLGSGRSWSFSDWLDLGKRKLRHRSLPRRALNLAAELVCGELALYAKMMGGMTRGEKREYAERLDIDGDYDDYWYFRRHWREDLPLLTRLQYLDFHTYLPDDILTKVDRVSMANSLEVRVPLLSRRLVELAFSLPERIRFHDGQLKGLMKYAYRGVLPAEILERGKKGFSVPARYLPVDGRHYQEVILAELFGI